MRGQALFLFEKTARDYELPAQPISVYDEPEVKTLPKIWSVADITRAVNGALENQPEFRNCWLQGEISNFKHHRPSGHWYFTLKDEIASLRSIMFRNRAERVAFLPADGLQVLVRGNLRLYERDGNIQFYAEDMQPAGLGALHLAFEQLKQQLEAEGLFAAERKRPIPRLPRAVGIVTSPTGAAIRDILNVIRRRYPRMAWVLAPAAVQGDTAPAEIVHGIENLNRYGKVDVIIVGRGGGSLEELWAFNSEPVARAISASRIPVISAVGHETDYTIADYVADLRAPTPSAAAELAVPQWYELQADLSVLQERLVAAMERQMERKRQHLDALVSKGPLTDPLWRIDQNRERLDGLNIRLSAAVTRFMADKNGILKILAAKLDLLSPLAILGRGYALAYGPRGDLLRAASEVRVADPIRVRLGEGSLICRVLAKETEDEN